MSDQLPAPPTNPRRRQRKPNQNAKSSKPRESKDFRLLEILKLIRAHLPITINGIAVSKIIDIQLDSKNSPSPSEGVSGSNEAETSKKRHTQPKKKVKQQIVANHIEKVIARDPLQPVYLSFVMPPSDPDFPFELDLLKFNLTIPSGYPRNPKAVASLIVLNSEIPRGFAVNIERGFKQIARLTKSKEKVFLDDAGEVELTLVDGKGLLSQIQTLDKYLESFLKQEKRQTMKFVTFKSSSSPGLLATPEATPPPPTTHAEESITQRDLPANVSAETARKRAQEIEEMTTKLGKAVKLFNKSAAQARYKVMIPITRRKNLPQLWTTDNETVDIFVSVPVAYPDVPPEVKITSNFSTNLLVAKKQALQDCGKSLVQLVEEAKSGEKNLRANVASKIKTLQFDLIELLNWISNNLSVLVLNEADFAQWKANLQLL